MNRFSSPIRIALLVLVLVAIALLNGACSSEQPAATPAPDQPAPARETAKGETTKGEATVETSPEPVSEAPTEAPTEAPAAAPEAAAGETSEEGASTGEAGFADVISVNISGQPGAYQFSVGIKSPDTGCDQYADWWEVITPDGELLYRRILLHSHVGEQPFTRSGGPVPIQPETPVLIRAHMNTTGYGGAMFQGSVQDGFIPVPGDPDLFPELAQEEPLPSGCAF